MEQTTATHVGVDDFIALNDQQKQAVTSTEGPSIVIAGAGSGKTRVLTARIAYLIKEKKAEPHQILALTFTNKAAVEMRHRIEVALGSSVKTIWLGTFHSVFMRLLRLEAEHIGYPAHFTIYDSDDSKSLIRHILKELQLDDTIYKPGVVLRRISYAKNKLITPNDYSVNAVYQLEDKRMRMPQFSEVFIRYTNYCLRSGAMDFDDLLVKTYEMLDRDVALRTKYQRQFHYLFIDEFQDTNLVQYRIAQKLAAYHNNICVVGDDAQSIYAFRGANIQNILSFSKDYPCHHIVKLEQNYRSTQHIVEVANHIISHNTAQLKKKVWTANALGAPIQLLPASSDREESHLVVHALWEEKQNSALRYADFVILYRTNDQSRSFEEALRKKNIPYRIVGGGGFYQRKEVKDLLAYLRFVVNHNDIESFKRIINYPKRGIGSGTVEKIVKLAVAKELSLWQLLSTLGHFLSGPVVGAVLRFVALIESATLKLIDENAYTIAVHVAKASGLLDALYADSTVEGLGRYAHLQELLDSIKQFVDHPDYAERSLGHFLQEISLMTNEDRDSSSKDVVTLMTVHASKGLEFKCVYLVGMEEELFPSAMMLGGKEELEEERRLFYVAVTRAQLHLTLSYALSRYRFGKLVRTRPSRFLREIDMSYANAPASSTKRLALVSDFSSVHASCRDSSLFQVGDLVRHSHFGEGKIVELIASTGMQKVVILFRKHGEKKLLLNYAKLELLLSKPC